MSISGRFYDCENGEVISNPFPFDIPSGDVKINGQIMAMCRNNLGREKFIELWDYSSGEQLAVIDDIFAVKRVAFEFTRNNLILHSDWGAVSIYNCSR